MSFFTPVFRHGLLEIMWSLLRLEQQQKRLLKIHFEFAYFSFFLTHFGIETINKFVHSHTSLENHTRFQTKMSKVYTPLRPKRCTGSENTTVWGGTYTYMAYIGEYPPGPDETEQFPLHNTKETATPRKTQNFWNFVHPSHLITSFV